MKNPVSGLVGVFRNYVLAQRRTIAATVGGLFGYQTVSQRNLKLFWDYYATNEIVFAAVMETIQASSVIPFSTERLVNSRWQVQPESDPVQERLANPNDDEDGILFRERTDTELVVTGNSIVGEMPVRSGERLGELRLLPTRNVWVIRDKTTNRVTEYAYDPTKRRGGPSPTAMNHVPDDALRFPPERVIHRIYAPDPDVPEWGMGPISAALDSIEADINITLYIKEFFRLGAVPPHLLVTETRLTEEQERQLQQRWATNVGGVTNAWKLGILSGHKGDLHRIGQSTGSREIGLQDLRNSTETRILAAMNVPSIVVGTAKGLEEASYSNYGQARQAMHEENTDPLIKKRDSAYTHYIRRRLGTNAVRVRGDMSDVLAVQERVNERSERASRELQSGMTMRNEARALVGMPPDSDGDVFYIPLNLESHAGSLVSEGRVRRLSLALPDHQASAAIIREQALDSGASMGLGVIPEGAIRHIMTEVRPRGGEESKVQFSRRILMLTHATVARFCRESLL